MIGFGLRAFGGRSRRALAGLFLLTALAGAFVLGSANAARRSATSFHRLVARSDAPDLFVFATPPEVDEVTAGLRARPDVAAAGAFTWLPFSPAGQPQVGTFTAVGPGFGDTVLRPVILRGRAADPARADEVTVNQALADQAGLRVGRSIHLVADLGDGRPPLDQPATVVGIHLAALDVGPNASAPGALGTPALAARWWDTMRGLDGFDGIRMAIAVRARPGADATRIGRETAARDPGTSFSEGVLQGDIVDGLGVESTALWALALAAGLATVGAVVVIAARVARGFGTGGPLLGALGASRSQRTALVAAPLALAVGAGVAAGLPLAWLSSPLGRAPLGRTADPVGGVWFDRWTALAGAALLATVAVAGVVVLAARATSDRRPAAAARRPARLPGLALSRPVAAVGLVGATGGADPAARRLSRSAVMVGAASVACMAAVWTWVGSNDRLQGDWRLQGWDFDASAEAGPGVGPDAVAAAATALTRSPAVARVARYQRIQVPVGGGDVDAFSFEPLKGSVLPLLVQGRQPPGPGEVVAGRLTLARLGKRVGDRIEVDGQHGPVRLTVVGEAVFPFLGNTTMGDTIGVSPETLVRVTDEPVATGFLVATAPGAGTVALRRLLGPDLPVTLPYAAPPIRHLGDAVAIVRLLVVFFAALGLVAFTAAVTGMGRRRLRDLAVVRALGFSRAQVAGASVVHVGALGALSLAVGIPFGVAAGRVVWHAAEHNLPVLDATTVPWAALGVTVAATGAALLAGGAALSLGTARRRVGAVLRTE